MINKRILQKLLRNIIMIIIIITALILIQRKTYNDYIGTSISKQYITDTAFRAEERFKSFYKPIQSKLIFLKQYGQSGLLNFQNSKGMNIRFIPVLEEIPQVHSIKFVSGDQQVYALTREDSQWVSDFIDNTKDQNRYLHQIWSHAGELVKKDWLETTYDVFQQPWYLGARDSLQQDQVWWTKPRSIVSANSQGITASVKWINKKENNRQYILAFDILLRDIYLSISNLQTSENSRVFLLRSDETVFDLTTFDSLANIDSSSVNHFVHHSKLKTPHINKAITHWKDEGSPIDEPLNFSVNQKTFWVGFRSIDREHLKLWIGVIIPENDILRQLQERQIANVSISAIILLAGLLITTVMVRKYRKQLTAVQLTALDENDLVDKVRELINIGESKTIEFKSTMRMNLKTNQPSKEIEIAWLKGANAFLNSEGGILLFGVNDAGEFVDLKADNFENDDKCRLHFKNLINQHIGAEFTSYLNFRLLKIENKSIGFLECTPSQKPVFLKDKNEEYFYIRSGPSNIKLQTSKILDYIEDRKK